MRKSAILLTRVRAPSTCCYAGCRDVILISIIPMFATWSPCCGATWRRTVWSGKIGKISFPSFVCLKATAFWFVKLKAPQCTSMIINLHGGKTADMNVEWRNYVNDTLSEARACFWSATIYCNAFSVVFSITTNIEHTNAVTLARYLITSRLSLNVVSSLSPVMQFLKNGAETTVLCKIAWNTDVF